MPFPVASAIAGGSVGIGKLKFQEYCITSLPGSPFQEQIKMLSAVHAELRNAVMAKFGVSLSWAWLFYLGWALCKNPA